MNNVYVINYPDKVSSSTIDDKETEKGFVLFLFR